VIVLIWVYYTAQLVLMGAEFTNVYARRYGSKRNEAAADRRQLKRNPRRSDGRAPLDGPACGSSPQLRQLTSTRSHADE
jgi:membrane protein